MNAPNRSSTTIAGIAVVAVERECIGCRKRLVCVQLSGVTLMRDDAVCFHCVPMLRAKPKGDTR